jgi:hypothetical protein
VGRFRRGLRLPREQNLCPGRSHLRYSGRQALHRCRARGRMHAQHGLLSRLGSGLGHPYALALAQPAATAMGRGRSRAFRAQRRAGCGRPAFDQRGLLQICRVLRNNGRRATHGHVPGYPYRPARFLGVRRWRRALHASERLNSGQYELLLAVHERGGGVRGL